jgi:hypothetical protein
MLLNKKTNEADSKQNLGRPHYFMMIPTQAISRATSPW